MKHELAALGSNSRRPSNKSSAETVIALFAADVVVDHVRTVNPLA